MSGNYIVINGKRAELTKEQMEQLGIEVKGKKRWRAKAKESELYFYVTDGGIVSYMNESNNYANKFMYFSHNYFESEGEARIYARVLETEMLLKKYADEHNMEFCGTKYQLYIDDNKSLLAAAVYERINKGRIIWFSSENIALDAIKEIGEERIKEYLTYEW